MKTWTAPEVQEMDVRLTAKGPGTVEQNAYYEDGWIPATFNSATHEWNDESGCLEEKKPGS